MISLLLLSSIILVILTLLLSLEISYYTFFAARKGVLSLGINKYECGSWCPQNSLMCKIEFTEWPQKESSPIEFH